MILSSERLTPLIISGAPRSGTSLIYNLFDGHPEISWLLNEGYLFEYLYDLGVDGTRLFLDAMPSDIDALIEGLRDKQIMPPLHEPYRQMMPGHQGVESTGTDGASPEFIPEFTPEFTLESRWSEDAFRDALADARGGTIAELWRWLVNAYLAGMGGEARRYACLKSPDYGKSASAAIELIPEAKALIIVRDPLYALDSLKRSREMRGDKLLTWPILAMCIRSFQRMHEIITNTNTNTNTDRFTYVLYESLLKEPKNIMRKLSNWLNVDFDDCLLTPTMCGRSWPGISSFQPTDGIEDTPMTRSIQALTAAEQDFILSRLEDFRADFGYA